MLLMPLHSLHCMLSQTVTATDSDHNTARRPAGSGASSQLRRLSLNRNR